MEQSKQEAATLQIGQPFNPFGIFTGIFIPGALVKCPTISAGAKLAYGRLARYAGQDGNCYPAVPTLAGEIGVSVRQVQHYLAELEGNRLIRRVNRFSERGQQSNTFQFLWHPLFAEGVKKTAPEGVQDLAPEGVQDLSPKESHTEESHSEEKTSGDLDYPATNRRKRDSRLDFPPPSQCKQYQQLGEALARYMRLGADDEKDYPSDRIVVEIMNSAGGASEVDIIDCLQYLYRERGLKPGTKNGPRHFSWFPTVVGDYFRRKRQREETADPVGAQCDVGHLGKEEFDFLTDAIEIDQTN